MSAAGDALGQGMNAGQAAARDAFLAAHPPGSKSAPTAADFAALTLAMARRGVTPSRSPSRQTSQPPFRVCRRWPLWRRSILPPASRSTWIRLRVNSSSPVRRPSRRRWSPGSRNPRRSPPSPRRLQRPLSRWPIGQLRSDRHRSPRARGTSSASRPDHSQPQLPPRRVSPSSVSVSHSQPLNLK